MMRALEETPSLIRIGIALSTKPASTRSTWALLREFTMVNSPGKTLTATRNYGSDPNSSLGDYVLGDRLHRACTRDSPSRTTGLSIRAPWFPTMCPP